MTNTTAPKSPLLTNHNTRAGRSLASGLAGAMLGGMLALTGCLAADLEVGEDFGERELYSDVEAELVSTVYAYAWTQQTTGSFVADSDYSRSSSGDVFGQGVDNTVLNIAPGQYIVTFPNIGTVAGGNVQVTAYGPGNERCKVQRWSNVDGAVEARVDCFAPTSTPINARFSIAYLRRSGTSSAQSAYVWANNPTASSYTPSLIYQFNSNGVANTIERLGVGTYAVTLPGMTSVGGTVEVTGYGTDSNFCKVNNWSQSGNDTVVNVLCHDHAGVLEDGLFTLNFANDSNPNSVLSYSYAWANSSTSAAYTPSLSYQKGVIAGDIGDVGTDITATRSSTGRYTLALPGMSHTGSNVQVTAYGAGADYCKVSSWFGDANNTQANVFCFDSDGVPSDARFVIVYTDDKFVVL